MPIAASLRHWSPTHPGGVFPEVNGRWITDWDGLEVDLDHIGLLVRTGES